MGSTAQSTPTTEPFDICELYIDDALIHGGDPTTFLANIRKVFSRLREFNVAVNLKKTKPGLERWSRHLYHRKILNFPKHTFTKQALVQFIGLANYFRDHMPHMTEIVKPL